jgi:hypothetical protein
MLVVVTLVIMSTLAGFRLREFSREVGSNCGLSLSLCADSDLDPILIDRFTAHTPADHDLRTQRMDIGGNPPRFMTLEVGIGFNLPLSNLIRVHLGQQV